MSYSPDLVPVDIDPVLRDYLEKEFSKLEAELAHPIVPAVRIQVRNVAPAKPREGDVYNADGTNWNPGGTGAGLYQYLSGAYVKL